MPVRLRSAALLAALLSTLPALAVEPEKPPDTGTGEVPPAVTPGQAAGEPAVSHEGGAPVVPVSPKAPIVPKPTEAPERAYQLYWELDVPILAVAITLSAARVGAISQRREPAYCIQRNDLNKVEVAAGLANTTEFCNPDELNALDRPFAGRWDPTWSDVSDVGAVTLALAPIVMLTIDEGFLNMLNDAVVIYQASLIATMLSGLSSAGTGRPRPFVYPGDATDEQRHSPEGGLSFFSGHTSFAFAMATSTFWTVKRRHRSGPYPWIVFGVGHALAGSVGVARIMAGKHFPTDVLGGVLVGMGVGTVVPMLHASPVQIVPIVEQQGASVAVTGKF